ncbi:3791_t:CDS:2, partial [Acaulospora colombiana]
LESIVTNRRLHSRTLDRRPTQVAHWKPKRYQSRILPWEIRRTKGLLELGVDRVVGNVSIPILVLVVADLERTDNVQDGISAAWRLDGGSQVELVTVAIPFHQYKLALEVVQRLLDGSDIGVETTSHITKKTHIVDGGETETETTWDAHSEGDLAALAVFRNSNIGSSHRVKVTERDSDGSPVG